jgi:ABC-type multidrug transport system ATPase subunit
MTVLENLSLFYNYHTNLKTKEILEKIDPYLKLFNIQPEKLLDRPHFLSTGERMLFNIIRAMLEDSDFFFWDEPIANLDMIERNKVKRLIKDKKAHGKTSILVTNDWQFGLSVADKAGVLHKGKLIFSDTPDKIQNSTDTIIKSLISEEG